MFSLFDKPFPPLDLESALKSAESKVKAKEAMTDLLLDMMLSADVPEECKVEIEILKQFKEVEKASKRLVEAFALETTVDKNTRTPELLEAQKAVRDYLAMTADDLKRYYTEAIKIKQSNSQNENQ